MTVERPGRRSTVALVVLAACGTPRPATVAQHCPVDRTVVIAGQDDVARFAGCTTASAVAIKTGAPLDLAPLHDLGSIEGDLVIGPSVGLTEASFGELRAVGGAIVVASNGNLRGLFFPRLERVGRIEVEANSALATLSLPQLPAITGSLIVVGNPDLELVDVAALTSVGRELVLADNAKLVLVEAAKLATAGSVRVDNNPMLPDDLAGALRAKAPDLDPK